MADTPTPTPVSMTPSSSSSSSSSSSVSPPYNFNAGPSCLPESVLVRASSEFLNFNQTGMNVMCMSHRSESFEQILKQTITNCRQLLQVPDTHTILLMHGGGTGGFASVPLNLTSSKEDTVSYIVTGTWSQLAAKEAEKYANVEIIVDTKNANGGYNAIPDVSNWKQPSSNSKYLYLCYNETQHGVAFPDIPQSNDPSRPFPTLVADMSSCFMSQPIDVSRFGVIYAGAQKNVGPSGVTVYIVRKDLIKPNYNSLCPSVLNWHLFDKANSMYNTPCTWSIYIMKLVFDWIRDEGGLEVMKSRAEKKSKLLYDAIDGSDGFYRTFVDGSIRSKQNICFYISTRTGDSTHRQEQQDLALQNKFVAESEQLGFVGLQGHRSVGALRASVYNGLTEAACQELAKFMNNFQIKYDSRKQKQ